MSGPSGPRRIVIVVEAPVAQVYDYLADPRNRPAWQSSLRDVAEVSTAQPRLGTTWVDVTAAGVRPAMEITEMDRPRRWVERGTWRGISALLTLDFRGLDENRTEVVAHFGLAGSGLWRPVAAAAQAVAPPAVRSDLRRAARILAAEPPVE